MAGGVGVIALSYRGYGGSTGTPTRMSGLGPIADLFTSLKMSALELRRIFHDAAVTMLLEHFSAPGHIAP
jgi:hypothetical protein